jgi:hypothetical protein
MNRQDLELLNQSIANLGDSLARRRQMEMEAQFRQQQLANEAKRTAVDQAFREAQMAHESRLEDAADRRADAADQHQQDWEAAQQQNSGAALKQNLLQAVMSLNGTGQLSDDGRAKVNQWLTSDPDLSKIGIQLTAPPNPSQDASHRRSALVQVANSIQQYRKAAAASQDPQDAALYNHTADLLEANLPASLHAQLPSARARKAPGMAAMPGGSANDASGAGSTFGNTNAATNSFNLPDGTIIQHKQTGQQFLIQNGQPVPVPMPVPAPGGDDLDDE